MTLLLQNQKHNKRLFKVIPQFFYPTIGKEENDPIRIMIPVTNIVTKTTPPPPTTTTATRTKIININSGSGTRINTYQQQQQQQRYYYYYLL